MVKDPRFHDDTDLIQRLGEVLEAEKASNTLTRVPDDFYEKASGQLRTVLAELENCDPEQGRTPDELYYRLSERLKRGRQVLESIYATRERKIVLLALNQSRKAGNRGEDRAKNVNMLSDEEDLFYSLKVDLGTARDRLLKYESALRRPQSLPTESGIDTTTDDFVEEPSKISEDPDRRQPMMKVTPAMEELVKGKAPHEVTTAPQRPASQPPPGPPVRPSKCPGGPEDFSVVRALRDIEPFVLPDGTSISLRKDDIASIPDQVARVLKDGGLLAPLGEGT